jgi:hypothetical protein
MDEMSIDSILELYKQNHTLLPSILQSKQFHKIIHSWHYLHTFLSTKGYMNYPLFYSILTDNPSIIEIIPLEHLIELYKRYPIPTEYIMDYFKKNPKALQLSKEKLSKIIYDLPTIAHFIRMGDLFIFLIEPIDYKLISILTQHTNIIDILSTQQLLTLNELDKTILEKIPIEQLADLCKKHNIVQYLTKKKAHELLRYDKRLLNGDFIPFIDDDILIELGYKDRVTSTYLQEIKDDITNMVILCASCHGGPYTVKKLTVSLTRIAESPWNICSFANNKTRLDKYHTFCSNHNPNKMELYPETTKKESIVEENDVSDWEKRKTVMKDRDAPDIHFFQKGDEMIYKRFEEKTDGKYDSFRFLLVKGNTRCFNLFSIKDKWNMEEILDLFPDKYVLFIDYSCSLLPPSLASLPPEKLKTLGGKRYKTRKVFKRK